MGKVLLPLELLEKLKCSLCSNYLSVFPIFIKCEGDAAVCGRCKIPNDADFLRDEAYEGLAQFLIFPCSMQKDGCSMEMQPKELKRHEQLCSHKKIECPSKSYSRCQWHGPISNLLNHFEQNHSNLLSKTRKFDINFLNSFKDTVLIPFNNEIFIVRKELDSRSGILWCTVEHLKQSENNETYSYQLKIENINRTSSYKFDARSTDVESDNMITKANVDFVMKKLNDPAEVIAEIVIFLTAADGCVVQEEQTQQEYKSSDVEWDVLGELECPVCFEYMLSPIYQCLQGHSICSDCKLLLTECPLCEEAINKTQNFLLERLTQKLKYPCKFYKNGCSFVSSSLEIKNHEATCLYGPYDCPLKDKENCTIKCNKPDLIKHIENNHNEYILKSDKVNILFEQGDSYEEYYLIKFASRIFKGCFKYDNNKFMWAVQLVGTMEDSKPFKFEVDIIDNTENKLRRYLKGICVPLSTQNQIFNKMNTYEYVMYDQVAHLITKIFSYRIRVVKE